MVKIGFFVGDAACVLTVWDQMMEDYFRKRYKEMAVVMGEGKDVFDVVVKRERGQVMICSRSGNIVIHLLRETLWEGVNAIVVALFEFCLIKKGILLLHASGLKKDKEASLFVGQSGEGKTTISVNASKKNIICDDVAIVGVKNKMVYTYYSPFDYGRTANFSKKKLIIKNIYLIKQGKNLCIRPFTLSGSFSELIKNDYLAGAGLSGLKNQSVGLKFFISDRKKYKKTIMQYYQLIMKVVLSQSVKKLYFPKRFAWEKLF